MIEVSQRSGTLSSMGVVPKTLADTMNELWQGELDRFPGRRGVEAIGLIAAFDLVFRPAGFLQCVCR